MAIFEGAGVAIVTPFYENGDINFEQLEKLIDFQIENSTDAIIICGTTGEASTMCDEEHLECIKVAVDRVKGRVPVIAGTGSNDTRHGIELTKNAKKLGVDATLQVTPYYNKATQKGLILHFTKVANAVSLPIILYNVPGRTGCNILPETAVTLAKNVENIVAIKEASGNIAQVAKLMSLADGCIDLYSGEDGQVVPALSLGGIGVISVLSNIAPKETHDMVMSYLNGDVETSRKIQLKAIPLVDALFCEVNPIPVKTALNLMGMNAGAFRGPMCEMEEANKQKLIRAMKDFGISCCE